MAGPLWPRARRGSTDEALIKSVHEEHGHALLAYATRLTGDRAAAEDVVQETLIRAWRDLPALREPARFDAWAHRLLVRACHDHVRAQRRRPAQVVVLDIDGPVHGDAIARFADRDQLERGFLQLSVDHRVVLVLTHYVGLRAPEIAELLEIAPGTVYSRLHYAVRAMRAALTRPELVDGASPRPTAPKAEHGR